MFQPFKLDVVDTDGAIREAAESVDEGTRRQLLQKGGLAAGGVVAGSALFGGLASEAMGQIPTPSSTRSRRNDTRILNFALLLEFLEAEFYVQGVRNKAPNTPALAAFAATARAHELTHVKTLRSILGGSAIKKPGFDFGDTVTSSAKFAATSQVLEDTGVMAYSGQAKNLLSPALLTAAATILSVEARHAGWIRFINGGGEKVGKTSPAPASFDTPKTATSILSAVRKTGFVKA